VDPSENPPAAAEQRQTHRDGQHDVETMVHVCRSARLTRAAYQFYRAILLAFVTHGPAAPEPATVAALARQCEVAYEATLAHLAAQDLVQRDPQTGRIRAAYPFSGVPTAHQVALLTDHSGEQTNRVEAQVFAMCALDALGIPLMLRRTALITSADTLSGDAITVLVRPETMPEADEGAPTGWITAWEPAEAAVFACPDRRADEDSGHDGGITSASYRCPVTNFFATAEHARAWVAAHPESEGVVLTQVDALARAGARFGGVLDRLAV
jgi:Alkylmercury lyase